MLDKRIYTFLELCDVMNYHKTAENLCMTQPGVTQHIKYLERTYGCKLFEYSNKQLAKTSKCLELENFARSIISLDMHATASLQKAEKIPLHIGATRTIGEYLLDDFLTPLLTNNRYEVHISIDNTERLLERLNHFKLDILMLEGYVNKDEYLCENISAEEIVGICAPSHSFANREVTLQELFGEHIILREQGSGTRAVLETFLTEQGYSTQSFANQSIISSNRLIERAITEQIAIAFVYSQIPQKNEKIATFRIKDCNLFHEFNYVFLNRTKAEEIIQVIKKH